MARQNLTLKRIADTQCPPEKQQIFLWDTQVNGLGVRITKGAKVFVYQWRLAAGNYPRIKIGSTDAITLETARSQSIEWANLVAKGIDPREEKKRIQEQEAVSRNESKRCDIKISDIWPEYLEDRKPHWSERHYLDHVRLTHPGGKQKKSGKGKTIPGALAEIMKLSLSDITPETVKEWISHELPQRKTQTRLGFEALRAFLNWCEDHPVYHDIASPDACSSKFKKNNLPKKTAKDDCLQKEQLKAWFSAVGSYHNKVISAYLQSLLLTGARREELLSLQWKDVDFKWGSISIKDKVEGQRTIPLTPYVTYLLSNLPKQNKWVFSSPTSANGRLQEPRKPHKTALNIAGIENLTLHGLRRSFGTLSEWVEVPTGIVYQIMGHHPSATAEKHYRKRPIDLLRMWHSKIEEWILNEAGIETTPTKDKPLRLVHKS